MQKSTEGGINLAEYPLGAASWIDAHSLKGCKTTIRSAEPKLQLGPAHLDAK